MEALDSRLVARYIEWMSPLLEKVFHEIDELPTSEQIDLYRRLRERFEPATDDGGNDEADIEAAWDEEIASRVKDIEEGRVELISGEEFEQRTAALFQKLGIERPSRLA